MTLRILRIFAVSAAAGGLLLLGGTAAHADFKLSIQSSDGGSIVVTDGGAGDLNPLAGGVSYAGAVGGATISMTTGASKPLVGGLQGAELDITSLDVRYGSSGTLTISLTDTGFTVPGSPGDLVTLSSSIANVLGVMSPGTSFSFQSYADASNTEFKTSGLSVTTTGKQGDFTSPVNSDLVTTSFARPDASSPSGGKYSLTSVMTIHFGQGGGTIGLTGSTQVLAAEPATLASVLACVPVAYVLRRYRARRGRGR